MKRFIGIVVVGTLLLPSQAVQACGDKLMSLARATRLYAAYKAWRSAAILIDAVHSATLNTVRDPELLLSLKQAGHKVQRVENQSQLDQALSSGQFDLVLADVTDAASLVQRVAPQRSRPLVLPVVYKPTKAELTAAEKQFSFVISAPARSTKHLEVIDKAMKSKVRGTAGA